MSGLPSRREDSTSREVELSGTGDATVVRVVVDSDAGTDLDDLADVSRELVAALDAARTRIRSATCATPSR